MSRRIMASPRVWAIGLAVACAALFVGANMHLLIVALESQPDCVDHLKSTSGEAGTFRAANSAC